MLYKTHQRYGLLSGILGIPLGVTIGLIPIITKSMRFSDAVMVILILLFGILSALFGAEFPDCDSYGGVIKNGDRKGEIKKGSIPSQKHPFISKVFRTFHVKHRGKFSHDYVSLAVFFGLIWLAQQYGLKFLQSFIGTGNIIIILFFNLFAIFLLFWMSRELAIKYKFKKNKKYTNNGIYLLLILAIFVTAYLITSVTGFTTLNIFSATGAFSSATFVRTIVNIIVIFTWIGAYSHLFADMLTNEGVHFAGLKIAPAKVVLKVKKVPFLPPIIFGALGYYLGQVNGAIGGAIIGIVLYIAITRTDLKTGSAYEDACYIIATVFCIPALMLAFINITGGDVNVFLRTLGII